MSYSNAFALSRQLRVMIPDNAPVGLGNRFDLDDPELRPKGSGRPRHGYKKNAGRKEGVDPIRRAGGLGFNSNLYRPAKAAVKHRFDLPAITSRSHAATLEPILPLR
jgi:hypothetical protein